jgi:PWWP domain
VDEPTEELADTANGDVEMKDTDADAEDKITTTNGTSTTPAKGTPRRKSSGVPEHKAKLNKKKSKASLKVNLDAKPGDYFFVNMKGYPSWPSIIPDEEMLPQALLTTRPVGAKRLDGTYKEQFEDEGKRVKERMFPIMFLATNEL